MRFKKGATPPGNLVSVAEVAIDCLEGGLKTGELRSHVRFLLASIDNRWTFVKIFTT
jgi:hypothetical protein